jgi:hypothetical protein
MEPPNGSGSANSPKLNDFLFFAFLAFLPLNIRYNLGVVEFPTPIPRLKIRNAIRPSLNGEVRLGYA